MTQRQKNPRVGLITGFAVIFLVAGQGCGLEIGTLLGGGGGGEGASQLTGLALEVATKADSVARQIGGPSGFGGMRMVGYRDHAEEHMGFHDVEGLADSAEDLGVRLTNELDQECTFHLSYYSSHVGTDEQLLDVTVQAGESVVVTIPCSEIVGLGGLETPGEAGCHMDDGHSVDNMMAVPGFMGQDFTCFGSYECVLTTDVDDLDGDGDTEESIIVSAAMRFHSMDGGPLGHAHGSAAGMMGSHMGS